MVCTVNPHEPEAVSIMYSPRRGLSILTHISITCLGVKYCPFSPFEDLLTRYSNASSITCKLELNSFTSCRLETQTDRCDGESSTLLSSWNTPGHFFLASSKSFCIFFFRSPSDCPVFLNSKTR